MTWTEEQLAAARRLPSCADCRVHYPLDTVGVSCLWCDTCLTMLLDWAVERSESLYHAEYERAVGRRVGRIEALVHLRNLVSNRQFDEDWDNERTARLVAKDAEIANLQMALAEAEALVLAHEGRMERLLTNDKLYREEQEHLAKYGWANAPRTIPPTPAMP